MCWHRLRASGTRTRSSARLAPFVPRACTRALCLRAHSASESVARAASASRAAAAAHRCCIAARRASRPARRTYLHHKALAALVWPT